MADSFVYEQAGKNTVSDQNNPFLNKRIVYVNDQMNGNYPSNQMELHTQILTNSALWCDYSNAYLEVPVVVAFYPKNNYAFQNGKEVSFDDSSILDSFQLEQNFNLIADYQLAYNNTIISQRLPLCNKHIKFKLITETNILEREKNEDQYGALDTPVHYQDVFDKQGLSNNVWGLDGLNENDIDIRGNVVNSGASRRAQNLVDVNDTILNEFYDSPELVLNQSYIPYGCTKEGNQFLASDKRYNTADNLATTNASSNTNYDFTVDNSKKASAVHLKYYLAQIPMKDLSSFLSQMSLVRGSFLSLKLQWNTAIMELTANYNGGLPYWSIDKNVVVGSSNPLLIADLRNEDSIGKNIPSSSFTMATDPVYQDICKYGLEMGVGSLTITPMGYTSSQTYTHPIIQTSRLAVPVYQFSPLELKNYLSLNSSPRRIVYEEGTMFQFTINKNATFNQLINSGVINSRYLLIVPTLTQNENKNILVEHSPFYPCGSPGAPAFIFQDFQVSIAGTPLFTTPLSSLDDFLYHDVFAYNALNGNMTRGLTSNRITKNSWKRCDNYLLIDLTKRLPSEDLLPKSISINGKSNYNKDITLTCYTMYEKVASIDIETGRLMA